MELYRFSVYRKTNVFPSVVNNIATDFWDSERLILVINLLKSQTFAEAYYASLLSEVMENLKDSKNHLQLDKVTIDLLVRALQILYSTNLKQFYCLSFQKLKNIFNVRIFFLMITLFQKNNFLWQDSRNQSIIRTKRLLHNYSKGFT